MAESGTPSSEQGEGGKALRGKGRGSNFFALGRGIWADLLACPTTNRLNLLITYLVLLAGSGSDHRLTKWSAKAIEQYTGMGKPRAKHAIEELISAELVKRTAASTRLSPQYELAPLPIDEDPIFLPVQLVTGLAHETPVLRRIRETGDALALRMLIDLYGMVSLDATYGVPIEKLRQAPSEDEPSARKVSEMGAHAIWALSKGGHRWVQGDWTTPHRVKASNNEAAWAPFWERVTLLEKTGAIWFEPWIFDGEELDAEPLIPVDPAVIYHRNADDDEAKLSRLSYDTALLLVGERYYLFDHHPMEIAVPLPTHHRPPALRGVARLRVEPDTPGRRLSYKARREAMERFEAALTQLQDDATNGRFDRPMRLGASKETY